MKKKEINKKIIKYKDELNDDFADNKIITKDIDENYQYVSRNFFFRLFSNFFTFFIALPILYIINLFLYRYKVKNRHLLGQCKHRSYYLYSNHVLGLDPILPPVLTNPFKRMIILASHDTFSIHPIVTFLVKALGAIPVPSTLKMFKNYTDCLRYHTVEKNHRILVYPEQHIWPYYTKIRNFSSGSFRYPVDDNVPVYCLTTVFKKKRNGKPKPIGYIDGPFYPNQDIPRNEAVKELRDTVYNAMKRRSEVEWNYEYIKYEKIS